MKEDIEVLEMLFYVFRIDEDVIYIYYGEGCIRVEYIVHDSLEF